MHSSNNVHLHIDPRPHLPETPEALTKDWQERVTQPRGTALLVISGILLLAGIAGVVIKIATNGFADRAAWNFYAATFAWVLSTAQAAPLLAVATRLTKGFWRKPLVRAAEMFTVTGLLGLVMLLPLLAVIPPLEGRHTFWVAYPNTPQLPLLFGMIAMVLCGLGMLYASSRPDVAILADRTGRARNWLSRMWIGTPLQWKLVTNSLTYFGAFYLLILVGVNFLVSVDLAISLVPGWRDAIFPAYHAITSFQAGLATLIIALGILRATGFRDYLALDQFWNPAKLLLALSLLWFYFWWSGFIILWYGRTPQEIGVLNTEMFGPYFWPFAIGFVCCFVIPVLLLIWNNVRISVKGPIVASIFIVVGTFLDRVRIYGGAFLADPREEFVEGVLPTRWPDLPDILIVIGAIGGVVFLYLLAMRIIPIISLWELREGQLLTKRRTLVRNEVVAIGKPE